MIRVTHREVPAMSSRSHVVLEPVADALLPWADPYIAKLAQALEREATEMYEAAVRSEEQVLPDDRDYEEIRYGRFDQASDAMIHRNTGWSAGSTSAILTNSRWFK